MKPFGRLGRLRAWLASPVGLALWLPPVTCQLVTGSTPPGELLHPPDLLAAIIIYGGGLLSAHELALQVRRHPAQGGFWPRLLLFGACYGVLVEGVMLKHLSSTDWTRLGPLADPQHGHLFGLNLTWGLLAIVHHTVLGVAAPLALIELLRPAARAGRWLTARQLRAVHGLFLLAVLLGALHSGKPAGSAYGLVVLLAFWLFRQARGWEPEVRRPLPPLAPWRVGLAAALTTVLLLAVASRAPLAGPHGFQPFQVGTIFVALLVFCWHVAQRTARRVAGGWSAEHQFALVVGLLTPWLLLAPLQAADAYHAETADGVVVLGLAGLWLLLQLAERRW